MVMIAENNFESNPVITDTLANLAASNYPINTIAKASDLGKYGVIVSKSSVGWRPIGSATLKTDLKGTLLIGGTGATYSQSGTTVTVTWASHGLTDFFNGDNVHLTGSTGALSTGEFSNFTYVNSNTFTCTSSVSQSTSGNLGANTSETFLSGSYALPSSLALKRDDQITFTALTCSKNSAGTKTTKAYYNDVSCMTAVIATTSTLLIATGFGTLIYQSDNTYTSAIGTFSALAEGNRTVTHSKQLTSGADWAYTRFNNVTFAPK